MTHLEGSEGQHPHDTPKQRIEFSITPESERGIIFKREPDNTLVISGHGAFAIRMNLPTLPTLKEEEAQEQPEPAGTLPVTDSSEAGRRESRALHAEQVGATDVQATPDAPESPVRNADPPTSGSVLDGTSPPVTDQYSGADKPSWERLRSDVGDTLPDSENEKFQLVGNPAKKLRYRVTRKTNTRIADFVLATHPDQETTQHWRIRAFGDEAEKVRDQVEVGQKSVEVTVYGPKYWQGRKKTKGGYEETIVKGYHAGFVKVPRQYRQESQAKN